jgi:hypothetical protein
LAKLGQAALRIGTTEVNVESARSHQRGLI